MLEGPVLIFSVMLGIFFPSSFRVEKGKLNLDDRLDGHTLFDLVFAMMNNHIKTNKVLDHNCKFIYPEIIKHSKRKSEYYCKKKPLQAK